MFERDTTTRRAAIAWLAAMALPLSAAWSAALAQSVKTTETIRPGELAVLMNSASPPTSYVQGGEPTGMAVELAEEIARRIGLTTSYKAVPDLATVLPSISNGQYDIAAVGMMRTPQRMEVVDFTGPWYYGWFPLLVEEASGISGYEDLAGKTVGVVTGSIQERYMQDNHPEISLTAFPNDVGSVAALNAGSVDGALTGSALLKETVERFPNLKVAARTPTPYPNAFPVAKGKTELKAAVDKALADMMADGTYVAIFDKWHPGDALPEPLYDDYPVLADQRAPGEPAPAAN